MKTERLQAFSKKVSQESVRRAYISYDMRSFVRQAVAIVHPCTGMDGLYF